MCHAHPHALHTHPLHTRGKAREHTPPSPPPSGFPQLSPASTLSLVCDTPPYLSLWVASSLHYTPCSQDALSFSLGHGSSSMGSGRTLGERSFSFNTSDLSSGTLFLSPLGMRSSVRHFPPFFILFYTDVKTENPPGSTGADTRHTSRFERMIEEGRSNLMR